MTNDKGEIFTFALNKFKDGRPGACVVILAGKHKLKAKKTKDGSKSYSHYIDTKPYVATLMLTHFENMFGLKIKAGEVRYGRLKLRMIKRK